MLSADQIADIQGFVIARHVYQTYGFHKVESCDKSEWGDGVVEERWKMVL